MSDNPFLQADLERLVAAELAKPAPAISAPAPEQRKGVSKWAQLAALTGHGADAASTVYALKQPGMAEANPLYGSANPSTGRVLGMKAGSAALSYLMQHLLGKKSPGLANAIGYGTGIGMGGVAAHNMMQVQKARKMREGSE